MICFRDDCACKCLKCDKEFVEEHCYEHDRNCHVTCKDNR
jgi:hypothetical protein